MRKSTTHTAKCGGVIVARPRPLGTDDSENSATLSYLAERWSQLPPHIREAVLTLVDCVSQSDVVAGGRP